LFAKATPTDFLEKPKFISLTNTTEVDPALILMILQEPGCHNVPLFTHNCQIKNELATLSLDNDSKMNLISQELVQHQQLPPTPDPHTHHLGWVQKGVPHITITRSCTVALTIGPSCVNVIWDMSPLDCVDLLLGLPYKQNRQALYDAKTHPYHLKSFGHTYVLTSYSITSPPPRTDTVATQHVINTSNVSLCLTHHFQQYQ
jgi:hypothetical protein